MAQHNTLSSHRAVWFKFYGGWIGDKIFELTFWGDFILMIHLYVSI